MAPQSKRLISYAQNAEDIVLWRGLRHLPQGSYIDVGAAHPISDNVTQLFYERGWSGINIEPDPEHAQLLKHFRQRDTNINAGVSNKSGEATFFRFPKTGFSTFDAEQAEIWKRQSLACEILTSPIRTLNDIIAEKSLGEIHFLKIDVEGFERQVLEGIDLSRHRPWIIVIEATAPLSNRLVADRWEDILLRADYRRCLFDGINLFYCAAEHPDIAERISYPANALDQYIVGTLAAAQMHLNQKELLLEAWTEAFDFAHRKVDPPALTENGQASSTISLSPISGAPPPRLFVDVTCLRTAKEVTGIQRVTLNIAACLRRLAAETALEVIFVANHNGQYRNIALDLTGDHPSIATFGAASTNALHIRPNDQWLSCELNYFDLISRLDLYRRMRSTGVRLNFWVYDLFPIMRPDWSPPEEVRQFRAWWQRLSVVADRIFCDSAKVGSEVERWMDFHPSPLRMPGDAYPQVHPMHLGADGLENVFFAGAGKPQTANLNPAIPRKKSKATFVTVATLHPRKSLETLLRSFELLWDRGHDIDLVLTGMPLKGNTLQDGLARHPRRDTNVFYSGYVDDAQIKALFGRCDAMIFPSFDEGFGLPVVEAALYGLPSIVRDKAVFREVGGDDLFYFDDAGPEALAATVEAWLALPDDKRRRVIPKTKLLTWMDVTQRMLNIMEIPAFSAAQAS